MRYELEPEGDPIGEALDGFFYGVTQPTRNHQRRMGRAIRREFARNFSRQGSSEGNWRPLAPMTVEQRAFLGYPAERPILIRSGEYMDSFVDDSDGNHVQRYEKTGQGFDLVVGSNDERAAALEFGVPSRNLPARPVTELDRRAADNVLGEVEAIHDHLWRTQVG